MIRRMIKYKIYVYAIFIIVNTHTHIYTQHILFKLSQCVVFAHRMHFQQNYIYTHIRDLIKYFLLYLYLL